MIWAIRLIVIGAAVIIWWLIAECIIERIVKYGKKDNTRFETPSDKKNDC